MLLWLKFRLINRKDEAGRAGSRIKVDHVVVLLGDGFRDLGSKRISNFLTLIVDERSDPKKVDLELRSILSFLDNFNEYTKQKFNKFLKLKYPQYILFFIVLNFFQPYCCCLSHDTLILLNTENL
jgi:hypothetical protein